MSTPTSNDDNMNGTDDEKRATTMKAAAVVPAPGTSDDDVVLDQPSTARGGVDNRHEDDVERQLGISEYLSDNTSGFSAVVKARYSDFLVHEVDLNGKIARLTSLEVPPSQQQGESPSDEHEHKTDLENIKETPSEKMEASNTTINAEDVSLESQLTCMIKDETIAKNVMSMLQGHDKDVDQDTPDATNDDVGNNNKSAIFDKFVTLPALEKIERKAVHEWVRNSLPTARADTVDGRIRIWHVKFEKEMSNYGNFSQTNNNNHSRKPKRQKPEWPKDRPDFLRFVLYKENLDTTTAVKELSRKGSRGTRIGYAGMKDKRGITTQFCTLYRTMPEQLVNTKAVALGGGGGNTKDKGFSVSKLGNFEYVSKELKLGMLQGNRFDIILRNVHVSSVDEDNASAAQRRILEQTAETMKDGGFINYFGTQRFGKFRDTHLVGIAAVQGNFRKAVDILMEPKADERQDIAQARIEWKERFKYGESKGNEASTAKQVCRKLNRFMTGEVAILQCLAKYPMDYQRAFGAIPFNLRTMFIHAVQSLIWNRATSYRISKMSKDKVLVGDLVDVGKGPDMVHVVAEEDIESNKYTIEDVVVPLVGRKTKFPSNELGNVIHQLLGDVGISHDMLKTNDCRSLVVNGDYRKIVCHPKDVDYEIREYYDPLQPLLQTDLMKLLEEEIVIRPQQDGESAKTAMIVGFTLPSSSYATIALRELMRRPTSNEFQKELTLE